MRHTLTQGIGPQGVNPIGTNFQIQLLKGEYLSSNDCPNFGDKKYRYYIENKFRFRNTRNEFSGFIMHRRYILPGYDADIINRELIVSDALPTATTNDCDVTDVERCNPDCPEEICAADGSDNITTLEPCGTVETSFFGTAKDLRVAVCRGGDCALEAATVNYGITDGTALKGTHYEVVDIDGNAAPAAGQLTWEPGESGCKYICLQVIGALDDDPTTLNPDCCIEEGGEANPANFTITLGNVTGTTLADCKEVEVSINNRG